MRRSIFACGAMLAAAAALSACQPAFAADMPMLTKAPPIIQSGVGSGFYLGANGGMTASKESYDFITLPGTGSLYPAGAIAGVTVGYGGKVGNAWIAIETDFDYAFTRSSTTCSLGTCASRDSWIGSTGLVFGMPLQSLTGVVTSKIATPPSQWPIPLAVPTGFAGLANLMPYVSPKVYYRDVSAAVSGLGNAHETMLGYGGAVGVRMPLTANLSWKIQYDYAVFNKNFVPASGTPGIFPPTFTAKTEQIVKAGIDYHL